MSYDIYFKEENANEIAFILPDIFKLDATLKKINVPNITVNQGLIEIGLFSVPLDNILFIKEV
jgi:hypothetical protein